MRNVSSLRRNGTQIRLIGLQANHPPAARWERIHKDGVIEAVARAIRVYHVFAFRVLHVSHQRPTMEHSLLLVEHIINRPKGHGRYLERL